MSDTFNGFFRFLHYGADDWRIVPVTVVLGFAAGILGYFLLKKAFKTKNYVAGMIVAVFVMLVYFHLRTPSVGIFQALLDSLKAFFLEIGFDEYINGTGSTVWFWTALYILAPMLTATALLTSVREFFHLVRIRLRRLFGHADIYVFSELNEKSVTLAEDIYNNGKDLPDTFRFSWRALKEHAALRRYRASFKIYFCDVYKDNTENYFELKEKADNLRAICLRRDISSVNFKAIGRLPRHFVNYFLIGSDENESIHQAADILAKHYLKNEEARKKIIRKNEKRRSESREDDPQLGDNMFLFTTFENAYALIKKPEIYPEIRVRIKNEVEVFTLNHAYRRGKEILEDAVERTLPVPVQASDGSAPQKTIRELNVLIIGLGLHGREMIKMLCWLCQAEGYAVNIHAFDSAEKTRGEFATECPLLLDKAYNRYGSAAGTDYRITLHCGPAFEVHTDTFYRTLEQVYTDSVPQRVFVSLGNDNTNIAVATAVNSFFEQRRFAHSEWHTPDGACLIRHMESVVYNRELNESFAKNRNSQLDSEADTSNIHYVGSIRETYSKRVIINPDLETAAREIHMSYSNDPAAFWASHYNYRSSVATAIFARTWHELFGIYTEDDGGEAAQAHMATYRTQLSPRSQELLAAYDEKPQEDRAGEHAKTEEERVREREERKKAQYLAFTKLVEHRRWNAYMITEGFIKTVTASQKALDYKRHYQIREFLNKDELEGENPPKIYNDTRPAAAPPAQ